MNIARLLIICPDRPGIVSAVSGFLFEHGANILDSDQHTTDPEAGTFFMRMEFSLEEAAVSSVEAEFDRRVASSFGMDMRFTVAGEKKRIALLASRYDHCLLDLLWRWRRGELEGDVGLVISNHADLRASVEAFGVPFVHVPVTSGGKADAEQTMLGLLRGRFDLVVLARYMQILSADFLTELQTPVVNIHHSFLPAFVGADPYARALERGVKIVGATAHYVTEALDAGPIIEQDVERVSHRHTVADLERIGRDIERVVLARAVKWHLEDRVLVDGNKTYVFS